MAPAVANTDGDRSANDRAAARARADAARRDSIARANARADSLRRAALAARTFDDERRTLLEAVHFDFNEDAIRPDETTLLDRKVEILRANPSIDVRIEGNADERGSDEYNLALGMRRAAAVERYITEHGIAANRLGTTSYGEERPVCQDHDESCWSRNRRDDVVITSGADRIVP